MSDHATFERLIAEALEAPFEGWDFSWIGDRGTVDERGWSYIDFVVDAASGARTMIDMGTGGGEFLASLSQRPVCTWATEAWRPNVGVAARRLRPLGVGVVHVAGAVDNDAPSGREPGRLPFRDRSVDLVINRHEAYSPRKCGAYSRRAVASSRSRSVARTTSICSTRSASNDRLPVGAWPSSSRRPSQPDCGWCGQAKCSRRIASPMSARLSTTCAPSGPPTHVCSIRSRPRPPRIGTHPQGRRPRHHQPPPLIRSGYRVVGR